MTKQRFFARLTAKDDFSSTILLALRHLVMIWPIRQKLAACFDRKPLFFVAVLSTRSPNCVHDVLEVFHGDLPSISLFLKQLVCQTWKYAP